MTATQTAHTMLDAALAYAARGWAVLPLSRVTKAPAIHKSKGGNGVHDATTDPEQIRAWWGGRYAGANIGIAIPVGRVAFDVDVRHGGGETFSALCRERGADWLDCVPRARSGGGGLHLVFAHTAKLAYETPDVPGCQMLGPGHYVVVAPSVHPDTGATYAWEVNLPHVDDAIPALPPWLAALFAPPAPRAPGETRYTVGDDPVNNAAHAFMNWPTLLTKHKWQLVDGDGESDGSLWRHPAATGRVSASMRHDCLFVYSVSTPFPVTAYGAPRGVTLYSALLTLEFGGDERALKSVLFPRPDPSWADKPSSSNGRGAHTDAGAYTLDDVLDVYRKHLHLPDEGGVLFALGVVAANLLPGDAVWGLIVGPPGCGKTETIVPLASLDYVHPAATITEAALLSGVTRKDRERGATGGLLRQVGELGILLAKDFSGVLSMPRDTRAQSLSALREIFDGAWARPLGSGGGRVLTWNGKCGLLGAVTPSIDRHSSVMGALGERFTLYRLDVPDTRAQARRRLANRGHEREMRDELAAAVVGLFTATNFGAPPRPLDDGEVDWLVDLTAFAVHARSAVERDGYDRQVVVMPSPEAPGRLVGTLGQLLAGLETIGVPPQRAAAIVAKTAFDSVPDMRRALLRALHDADEVLRASDLATTTRIPKTPLDRTLEDLVLLGLVHVDRAGTHDTAARRFTLTPEARAAWPAERTAGTRL